MRMHAVTIRKVRYMYRYVCVCVCVCVSRVMFARRVRAWAMAAPVGRVVRSQITDVTSVVTGMRLHAAYELAVEQ